MMDLKARGVRLIDQKPRVGAEGYQIAFVHPYSTGGVLVELSQAPHPLVSESKTLHLFRSSCDSALGEDACEEDPAGAD